MNNNNCINEVVIRINLLEVKGKSKTQLFILVLRSFCLFIFKIFTPKFIGLTAMKHHLKLAINFLASFLVMVSGTMQVAQADEVWLDFSVSEADVVVASTTVKSQPFRPQKIVPNAKLVALDFSVPNADTLTAPVTKFVPEEPEPVKIKSTPALPKKPSAKPLSHKTRSKEVTALRRAIIGQESAGKFWIINPDSGALGYGQLLQENVEPWTKAALGRSMTVKEFLANPELQIQTIDHKLDEYLQRELAYTGGKNEEVAIRRVAATWYSGNPKLWNNPSPQFSNGRRYPSIESYTYSVWRRYQREIG